MTQYTGGYYNPQASGGGNISGPGSSTDNAIVRWDGTDGSTIQNSGATIDDSGNLTANNISGTNTGDQTSIVGITGTAAEFDTACSDDDFAYQSDITGFGDVTGPASSTDNAVARFDSTTGKLLQNSTFLIDDTGNATQVGNITGVAGGITLSTATNGNITLDPGGSGTTTINAGSGGVAITTDTNNTDIDITPHGTGSTNITEAVLSNNFTVDRTATAVDANTGAEMIIGVTDTSVARTITLDTDDAVAGRIKIIKDESGAAATNNITVATEGAETIDGASTITISANYGVARVYSDGTNWFTF